MATQSDPFGGDPVMERLREEYGPVDLEDLVADDEFERLLVSIVNQSISTASADAVRGRVFALFEGGRPITPEAVLAADESALVEAGLGRQKTGYVRNAARAFANHDLTREGFAGSDDAAVIDRLTEIRGIGEWTTRMYLLFALGREDVLPLGDLAVRRAIEDLYGAESRAEMRSIAESWRPHRSRATVLLWRWYEDDDRAPLA